MRADYDGFVFPRTRTGRKRRDIDDREVNFFVVSTWLDGDSFSTWRMPLCGYLVRG